MPANRGSTTTRTQRSGRCALSRASAGVVSTQSPSDRNRITAIRERGGRRSSKVSILARCLFFDMGFVDQHHGDVVANRVHPLTLDTLQAVFVLFQLECRFAQRADEDL